MTNAKHNTQRHVLGFAASLELGTGTLLMLDPALMITLLLGDHTSAAVTRALARCFGVALVALGLACWPQRPTAEARRLAVRAMCTYNALIALYLAYLRVASAEHMGGWLLWPAVALHALVGAWLFALRD